MANDKDLDSTDHKRGICGVTSFLLSFYFGYSVLCRQTRDRANRRRETLSPVQRTGDTSGKT